MEPTDAPDRMQAVDHTELELLKLANDLHPIKKALLKGIVSAVGKLPACAYKDEKCLGEDELTCSYCDPVLSRLLANPADGVHLRWSDIIVPETPKQRPDAVISKMRQLSFGPSLGFGEAKVQNAAGYDLCHDLLRLAVFSKESIDLNKLAGCLFSRSTTDLYNMIEIGHVAFPRSIRELPSFVNLATLTTLLRVGDAFLRFCHPAADPSLIASRFTPTPSYLYEVVSVSRCSARECSIRFEK
ncbi:hypothetical protein BCR43DRAFT_532175 [Syncephalastrum racemosum]|uniref:Uncharacterized protein n=1 Tax=Syncephalastrum racemosum TaxID=13706 RepID=A0A1X2H6U0_SYNRA|nr:hypothetical protein BCR43DRAFT_532175 [Syncephalastrum racemosum]